MSNAYQILQNILNVFKGAPGNLKSPPKGMSNEETLLYDIYRSLITGSGSGGGGNTIYTADDALTGNRILDGGGFSLDLGATGAELFDFNVLATNSLKLQRRVSGLVFTTLDLSGTATFNTRSNSMFGDVTFAGSNGKGDFRTTIDNGVNYAGIEIDQVSDEVEMYFNGSDSYIKVGATVGAVVKTISGTGLNYDDRTIDEASITTADKNHIPSWGFIESNLPTLYTSDSALTGNRTVTGAYSLDINVTGSAQSRFVKSGDGLILQSTNTRIQKGSNVIRLEAGSITVSAAGSGLGIAYDDRTIDEASVGAWGTTPNHIPSEARIRENLTFEVPFMSADTSLSGSNSGLFPYSFNGSQRYFEISEDLQLIGIEFNVHGPFNTSNGTSQIGVKVKTFDLDGSATAVPTGTYGTEITTHAETLIDTSAANRYALGFPYATKDIQVDGSTTPKGIVVYTNLMTANSIESLVVTLKFKRN